MNIDDLPEIDLDVEELPVVDLDAPMGKPRPAPPRPKKKPRPLPRKPLLPPWIDKEEVRRMMLGGENPQDRIRKDRFQTDVKAGYRRPRSDDLMYEDPYAPETETISTVTGKRSVLRRPRVRPYEREIFDPVTGKPLGPPALEQPGWARQHLSEVIRLTEAVPQLARGTGEAVDAGVYLLNRLGGATPEQIERTQTRLAPYIRKVTDPTESFIRGVAPLDPAKSETMYGQVLGGLRSAGQFVGLGVAGKAIGIPSKVITGIVGSGLNIASALDEAEKLGHVSSDQRAALTILSGLAGLTEMAGLGKSIEGFGLSKVFKARLLEVFEEGGQEGVQQWLNNLNMVITRIDPNRPLTRDVLESAILGGAIGGIFQGVSFAKQKLFEPTSQPSLPVRPQDIARIPPPPGFQGFQPKPPSQRVTPRGKAMVQGPMKPGWDMMLMGKEDPDDLGAQLAANAKRTKAELGSILNEQIARQQALLEEAINEYGTTPETSIKDLVNRKEKEDPILQEINERYNKAYFAWQRADTDLSRGRLRTDEEYQAEQEHNRKLVENLSKVSSPVTGEPPTQEEIDEIFRSLDQAPTNLTPGGRKKVLDFFPSDIDNMSPQEYDLALDKDEAWEHTQDLYRKIYDIYRNSIKEGQRTLGEFLHAPIGDSREFYKMMDAAAASKNPLQAYKELAGGNQELETLLTEYFYAKDRYDELDRLLPNRNSVTSVRQRNAKPSQQITEEEYQRREQEDLDVLFPDRKRYSDLREVMRQFELGAKHVPFTGPERGYAIKVEIPKILAEMEELKKTAGKITPTKQEELMAKLHRIFKANDYSQYGHMLDILNDEYERTKGASPDSYPFQKARPTHPEIDKLYQEYVQLRREAEQPIEVIHPHRPIKATGPTATETEQEAKANAVLDADVKRFGPVRTTPGGRTVYGVWQFSDEQVDNMSQEEYDSRQELTELHGLQIETLQKLWPFFEAKGYTKPGMLDHIKASEKSDNMARTMLIRGIKDPEAVRLAETYAYIIARLPMLADETTERINRLLDRRAEEEGAFEPEVSAKPPPLTKEEKDEIRYRLNGIRQDMWMIAGQYNYTRPEFDNALVQAEKESDIAGSLKQLFPTELKFAELADEYARLVTYLLRQPPQKTGWEIEEEKFLAPSREKKPGETDYGIMYKPTGIEEWDEKKRQAIEEAKRKEDPDAWAEDIDPDLPMMGRVPPTTPNVAAYARQEELPPYTFGDPKTGYHGGYDPKEDDLAFDVMPPLGAEYGRAPYLRVPGWVFDALAKELPYTEGMGGVNMPFSNVRKFMRAVMDHAPTREHARVALAAITDVYNQAKAEGLSSIGILNLRHDDRGLVEHELTHVAQISGLRPHSEWAMNHPLIQEVLKRRGTNRTTYKRAAEGGSPGMRPTGMTVEQEFFTHLGGQDVASQAAMEAVAYWVQDQSHIFGMSEREGRQFFKDYINHLRTRYGQQGVDRFKSIGRFRQEVLDVIAESNQEWGRWNQKREESGMPAIIPSPLEEMEETVQGGKKNIFQKMLDAVTKRNRQEMILDPPAPVVPPDEPPGTPDRPTPPPRDLVVEGPYGPLRQEQIRPAYTQLLTRTFLRMLEAGGLTPDPTQASFEQVVAALKAGELRNVDIGAMLTEEGLDWSAFADELKDTVSDSARTMQSFSEIAKFWDAILDEYEVGEGDERGKPTGGATGPRLTTGEALLRLVPIDYRIRRALRGVRSTSLGKNFWQRAGNATQKAMLTQLSTAIINTATSSGTLPLRIVSDGMGAWMFHMAEGQGNFMTRLNDAAQDRDAAMEAGMTVLMTMHPRQVKAALQRGRSATLFGQHQTLIHQLGKVYPDLERKLFALSGGTEALKKGRRELSIAKALIPHLKLNDPKRDDFLKQIQTYEDRLESNTTGILSLLNKGELVYDTLLQPMQFAEYFLRRPMFVGQLTYELEKQGLNLSHLLATGQLDEISPETMEKAINRALEFTYAYMPGTKTGTNYAMEQKVEKAAAKIIEWANEFGGPLNALIGEPFLKAAYNGAKFAYEWSPLGGILPSARILRNKTPLRKTFNDPVTGAQKPFNPTTQEDYNRLAKAMLGTFMYGVVAFLRHTLGGEEWWQIRTKNKGPDGKPVYADIRRLKPVSVMFQLYDFVERAATGRLGDINVPSYLWEIVTGIRMYDNQMGGNIIESMVDYFRGEPEPSWESGMLRGEEEVGKALAVYITPMLNVRDLFAEFIAEENVKKDVRGETVLGPSLDRIPFLRRLLPNLTSPTEPSPIPLSNHPLVAQLTGFKEMPAENFAGREWARLGLKNKTFLPRLTDPMMNRAQNETFQAAVDELGKAFQEDPLYTESDDATKAALWEMFINGDEGLAAMARDAGAMANPEKAMKDAIRKGSGMGRLQRKSTGFDKQVDEFFKEEKK